MCIWREIIKIRNLAHPAIPHADIHQQTYKVKNEQSADGYDLPHYRPQARRGNNALANHILQL
ncbi:hypothetical protein [Nitrosomonas sp.]|uniref:hypothetical protein n=1 Tax=Nitrosomonas sp. TaxID=42353 RepID=UPI0033056A27